MKEVELEAPLLTDVAGRRAQIEQARVAGDLRRAARMARGLDSDCAAELDRRKEVAEMVADVKTRQATLDTTRRDQFFVLVKRAAYDQIILCGEGLLRGRPAKCDAAENPPSPAPAPAASSLQPSADESEDDSPADDDDEGPRGPGYWPWVTMGAGAAFLITGAVLGGVTKAKYDELSESCPDCTQEDIDSGKRTAVAADVLLITGGVVAAGGLIWYLIARLSGTERSETDVSVGLNINGGFIVKGQF